MQLSLRSLSSRLSGKIKVDPIYREIYATDASIYYEQPIGVAFPKGKEDVQKIIYWANETNCPLIPRGAGTSLAGQVVGKGLVVDMSRFMNSILDIDKDNSCVNVQPGVVLDVLNKKLKPYGLLFGPETSTASRCVIGGMLGNNSCGLHSLVYGAVRDHVLEVKGYLSNGDEVVFKDLSFEEFEQKCQLDSLEGKVYKQLQSLLTEEHIKTIQHRYPEERLKRRNNGYALDAVAQMVRKKGRVNLCKLIAGSEGTLFFATEIKLNLVPIPPSQKALLCVHCHSVNISLKANVEVLRHKPSAAELMDRPILELATKNKLQKENLFFIHGKPEAVLMVEFWDHSMRNLEQKTNRVIEALKTKGLGYSYPVVYNADIKKVWNVRKAGLGVLMNMVGDAKPTCIIEDTAVIPEKLPRYIAEMDEMLRSYDKEAVYYAHAGSGELHIRPIINLKSDEDRKIMRAIANDTLALVKKYKGSISGEHGDGRLRGEFLEAFFEPEIYGWFKDIKQTWDPKGLFNPNKIVDAPPMDKFLRVDEQTHGYTYSPELDWSESDGFLRGVERCTGAGDCRKPVEIGGAMCPSFMALNHEKHNTRARANALRSFMYGNKEGLTDKEVLEVLDLCLSCKACKSECPSNVDMAKLKAEFLQSFYVEHGVPRRSKWVGNFVGMYALASRFPVLSNFLMKSPLSYFAKVFIGFHPKRSLPKVQKFNYIPEQKDLPKEKTVVFFLDEFTKYNDGLIGAKAVSLLEHLGYRVLIPELEQSGRVFISKGLLRKAKRVAVVNVEKLAEPAYANFPVVGVEPSAVLTFRDEYPSLMVNKRKEQALNLAKRTFTMEEYLHKEWKLGHIKSSVFHEKELKISFHAHCYQKALSNTLLTKEILSIPKNYKAHEIDSGCCGMAGAFGFEKEHYEVSMQVAELKLLPAVRSAEKQVLIVAAGTSCRHQIKDGAHVEALHPVEVLFGALK